MSPAWVDHGRALRSNFMKALLAGIPPLFVYVSTASGYAHWFDSGEFVAAVADFGISHPPGHPLAAIVLGAANLAPIGALSFRVALVCALLGSVAAVALYFAFETTLKVGGVIREPLRFPLALGATWWVVGTQAWWFQAVRPEVYALQVALLCIAIERLLRVSLSGPDGDVRPLYHSALAFGLALANHHYLAALAVVPSLWLLIGIWRTWGWRPFAWSAGFSGAGLLTYLYLPLRAFREPFLNLGDPSSPGRFLWVVTAKAFQKSISPDAREPFGERFADVLMTTGEDLHVASLVVALLGAYFMLRVKSSRKYGFFWLTLWMVYALGRAAIGFVRGNPDANAYFMLSYAALAVFVVFAAGVLLSALAEAVPSRPKLAPALATVLALAASFQFIRSSEVSTLADFADTDVFDDGLRRALPPRSIVLVHNPQTIFRYWGGEAEEQNRPDVTMIPLPLLTYPGLVDRLVTNEPELTPLLRSYLAELRRELPGSTLRIMQSSGGLTDAARFRGRDAILSGPAGVGHDCRLSRAHCRPTGRSRRSDDDSAHRGHLRGAYDPGRVSDFAQGEARGRDSLPRCRGPRITPLHLFITHYHTFFNLYFFLNRYTLGKLYPFKPCCCKI